MLVKMEIENFRSIKEDFSFSMIASKSDHSLERNLIMGNDAINMSNGVTRNSLGKDNNLLRSAAIYGANASGKSNSLLALTYLKYVITRSIQNMPGDKITFHPFKLDKKYLSKPCKFDIDFISEGVRYNYGASFTDEEIIEEYLYYYPKGSLAKVFERKNGIYNFTIDKAKQKRYSDETLKNVFYLASSSKRNYNLTIKAFKWFNEILTPISQEMRKNIVYTLNLVEKSDAAKQTIIEVLRNADFGITNFKSQIEEVLYEDLPEKIKTIDSFHGKKGDVFMRVDLRLLHKGTDENGNKIEIPFELEDESDGTKIMFSLLGPWIDSFKRGLVLVIDELDCELHPLLCKSLIQMFNDPESNVHNAQLIFTAHNTYLMNSELLRRDQIWFTEKNNDIGNTEIYSLLEYKQRQDANFEKCYLNGKYGAIPYIIEDLKIIPDLNE